MYLQFLKTIDSGRVAEMLGRVSRLPAAITTDVGRFLWANMAWCRMLGYTLDELTGGVDWGELTSGENDLEADRLQVMRLKEGQEREYEIIKHYVTKAGSRLHVRLTVTRFPADGQLEWFFVQAEVLGNEQSEAFKFATDQVERVAQVFAEKHDDVVRRLDRLIIQQAEVIELWRRGQWVSDGARALVGYCAEYVKTNPVWSAIVVLSALTLVMGPRVVDTVRDVAELFGVRLGIPISPVEPGAVPAPPAG